MVGERYGMDPWTVSLTVVVMNLITVEEGRPANPFSGKHPPRSLNEFFAEVLDKDLLD